MNTERCALCSLPRVEDSWYCDVHTFVISHYARLAPPERSRKDRIEGAEDKVRTFGARRQRVSEHEWCQRCGMAAKVGKGSCPLC
jgi:hypothetical protein